MAHHKHPPIKRPQLGKFGRLEVALVGTTCARIDGLLQRLRLELAGEFNVLTVTGDHGEATEGVRRQSGSKVLREGGGWNDYDDRLLGSRYDLVLVNGNHYPAAQQIVFIDPKKAGTLERRREQLTDVLAVIGDEPAPDWLREHLPEMPRQIPDGAADAELPGLLRNLAAAARPPLKAVILTGGKSTRMGRDKAGLVYHDGTPEAERLHRICADHGLETFFSVSTTGDAPNEIPDRFVGLGPMGAIASAFLFDPDAAWLVLACDLPLINESTVRQLIERRNPARLATAVRGASKPFPEPLIAIYEPRAYARLLEFLAIGYACPRKVLINSAVEELVLTDEAPLTNANTPEERKRVVTLLSQG